MPAPVLHLGEPPWADVAGHPCIKYGRLDVALRIASPWVARAIGAMLATFKRQDVAPLVDVRWWRHLDIGDIPGVPGWHYDCFNAPGDRLGEHRLYVFGAGSRTEFQDGLIDEGYVYAYRHNDIHRISPAMTPGPRLLIRLSQTTIRPANHIYADAHVAPA